MNAPRRPDGIAFITYLGVELAVGYEIREQDEFAPTEFLPMWAAVNGVDITPLIDAIDNGWEELADKVAAILEAHRDSDY